MKNFFFLSGLPRSGSTLLTSILSQNPDLYAGGNSALCQLMWDNYISLNDNCSEQLLGSQRTHVADKIMQNIPYNYYYDINQINILDKCRSWTMPANFSIIKEYISKDPKIIVMTRSIDEIVKSFIKISNNSINEDILFQSSSDPLMRSLEGVLFAKENNYNNNFLFIQYNYLISNTEECINKIYNFLNIKQFNHNFTSIENIYKENDSIYKINNLHSVRGEIKKIENNIQLSDRTIYICKELNKLIEDII